MVALSPEMNSCTKCLLLLVFVGLTVLVKLSESSPLRPYQTQIEEKSRQDIITLAARVIKIAMYGSNQYDVIKRNAGTVDHLLNFPDLSVGK
ncbi:hypothetical protein LOTGIDRAFT_239524 [Lottia gigantea]|uniref:Uncharacterized protein n=1 Tax=Lottia gigantea TaxID=225164 RepID=V4AC35_LOTGI|nr:hypothetical protein LOTGIDRAFT_239524 [Lottia gigantea]ESO94377.1 hypothetical protein LOTGIDRAFT_239524 [Lottia gigantea]